VASFLTLGSDDSLGDPAYSEIPLRRDGRQDLADVPARYQRVRPLRSARRPLPEKAKVIEELALRPWVCAE
jgi:hypothetical protein